MITSESAELAALRAENQALKARLEEAEGLLRVILVGEVDIRNRIQEVRQARIHAEQYNALLSVEIAERKRTEAALREQEQIQRKTEFDLHASNELLHNIINSSPSLIFALDRQHRFILANQAYFMSLDTTAEQLFGLTELDTFPQDTSERLWADNEEIMVTGRTLQHEQELQLPNGTAMTVVSAKFPLRDKNGQTIGLGGVITDITSIKQTERALKASEERLRLAMDAAQLVTFEWDIVHNQINLSQRHMDLWGFGPGEFGGHYEDFASRVHPDDLPSLNDEVSRCIATHDRFNWEFRLVWSDSSLCWVTSLGEFSFDSNGQVIRLVGVVRDITERKHMELLLVEAEATRVASLYTRNLIEASLDPMVTITPDGKITDANVAAEAVIGWPREMLIGNEFANYFTEPMTARAGVNLAFKTGSVSDYALEISHRNGHLTPVMFNVAVYRDESGKVVGVFAIARDITEIKQAEKALRESESKFSKIFHDSPVGIAISRISDGKFIDANDTFLRIYGLTREELIGHSSIELGLWLDLSLREKIVNQVERFGFLKNFEVEYQPRYGKKRTFLVSMDKIDVTGERCLLGMVIDITERKRTEKAIQQLNENLEQRVREETEKNRQKDHLLIRQSRSAAMGEMIGNIAHQWRQPLNALGLILANIKDAADYQELTPEYLEGLVGDGERLIQKMSSTIDDFRHFFRPQKQPEIFSVANAIKESISLVASSFAHNNIELCLDIDDEVQLIGFANEFSQVLLNLLSNAKDAILSALPSDGLVTIRLCSDVENAIVAVTDNGGGIPSAVIEKIFDPYFSTREKGTGIGLYMSKMIVENSMHGTISVCNVDNGAEFTLVCPLQHHART